MMKIFFVMLSLLVGSWAHAQSCNNMQLQVNQTAFDFSSSTSVNPTLVVKANTNGGGCDFFITFGYGLATSYSTRSLRSGFNTWPFQISKDASGTQIIKRIPDLSSANDYLSGTLTPGSNDRQVNVNYWASLDMSNPWRPQGFYLDSYVVTLYKGNPFGSYSFVSSNVILFQYQGAKRVDISIVPTGGNFDVSDTTELLNFGTLTTGATKSCDAVMKYNAGYILRASSANNGRLKHQTENEFIDYTATFDGVTFSLSNSAGNPVQVDRVLGQSPASGTRIPISVTIGNVANKRGGQYNDTITLTVQSAE